jgi:hypothetical protein
MYMPVTRENARKTHTHTHTHTYTYTYYEYSPWFSITLQAGVVLVSHSRAQRLFIAILLFDAIGLKQEQLMASLDKPHVNRYQLNENTGKRNKNFVV